MSPQLAFDTSHSPHIMGTRSLLPSETSAPRFRGVSGAKTEVGLWKSVPGSLEIPCGKTIIFQVPAVKLWGCIQPPPKTNMTIAGSSTNWVDVWTLLNMGIFQPVMLVFRGVTVYPLQSLRWNLKITLFWKGKSIFWKLYFWCSMLVFFFGGGNGTNNKW